MIESSRIIALIKSEESPCIQGQTAGETPDSVSWWIGPQKIYHLEKGTGATVR